MDYHTDRTQSGRLYFREKTTEGNDKSFPFTEVQDMTSETISRIAGGLILFALIVSCIAVIPVLAAMQPAPADTCQPFAQCIGTVRFNAPGLTGQDRVIYIARHDTAPPFNPIFNPEWKEDVIELNPGYTPVMILPGGNSEPYPLYPGEYVAIVQDSRITALRMQRFIVEQGQDTDVVFSG